MTDDSDIGDRYQVPPGHVEAEFVDEACLVLVNKPGITNLEELQRAEEAALARAYERLLSEVRVDTPMTSPLIRHIHATIFGELFEWAGRWRTVQISKPGAIWPPPQFIDRAMTDFEQNVLAQSPRQRLDEDAAFCAAVGVIQGEFLAIHPFREGNARTIKLMTNLLAVQTGKPMLAYDSSKAGSEAYIAAAQAALLQKDYQPLTTMAEEALQRARNS